MRYFIFSDIHANLPALETVLTDTRSLDNPFNPQVDKVINLGDIIGYMPYPNECMDILWTLTHHNLIGNHDEYVENLIRDPMVSLERSNFVAQWGYKMTAEKLNDKNKKRLKTLIEEKRFTLSLEDTVLFTHSNPKWPTNMSIYMEDVEHACPTFFNHEEFSKTIAFVGHIHRPQIYGMKNVKGTSLVVGNNIGIKYARILGDQEESLSQSKVKQEFNALNQKSKDGVAEQTWDLSKYSSALVVVPSVGQPRDGQWYTGYTIFDSKTKALTMRRMPYSVERTQREMLKLSNCPDRLIQRIKLGQ